MWLQAWALIAAPIPVILDTDIGDDIDDTWALAMLLGMPQLDLKLIVTDYGNTPERTRLTAKILERVGRTDIPIATGVKTGDDPLTVSDWVGDFNLATYPGKVHQDGVRALIDTINAQTQTVTLITIGPVPNLREALRRDPGIAQRARVVCTGGRIYKGFENGGKPSADWNVRADATAWQALVAAPWEITTSPLDGSEEIVLRGRRFAKVAASDHPLARVVMENYEHWKYRGQHPKDASSILYDTAAVYLASAEDYCVIKTLKLAINEQGHTVRTPDGKEVRCHLAWKNRDAFDDYVVQTLTESARRQASPASSAPTNQWARPELVREVLAGARHEARVSWWGFDARDSTEQLQQAINSRAKRLIIDRQSSAWVTRPLSGVSHQEIIVEAGAELVALKGAYRAKGDGLLTFQECEDIAIRGEKEDGGKSARLRMHKEDYQSDAYEQSEWRHGLAFFGCQDVLVQDLAIEKTGGDGIYLGATPGKNLNRNVVIRRVDCDANHRQGISVISAENLLIEDCLLRNTRGTAPQAGIDFEPNDPAAVLVNCVMRRCVATNNAGTGFQICPQFLSRRSRPISLSLEDCVSRGNQQHAVHFCGAPKDAPTGRLRILRLDAANDGMAGLSVQFNPCDAVRIDLEDSVLRDCAQRDSFFPPLYLEGLDPAMGQIGNLHFRNVLVKDEVARTFFKIRARKNGLKAITGNLTLERNGQRERIELDEDWLEQVRLVADAPARTKSQ